MMPRRPSGLPYPTIETSKNLPLAAPNGTSIITNGIEWDTAGGVYDPNDTGEVSE